MAWARVDDGWWCHPKVLGLDLDARGLWVSALSWSCQQQTSDIPHAIVRMCGDDGTAAAKLVMAGLWTVTSDGFAIHDWDEYQSERAKKAAAGRLGGKRSGETRRAKQADEADDGASSEAETGASTEAGPSRPDPAPPDPKPQAARARTRATQLSPDWTPPPEMLAEQQTSYPHVDLGRELERFRNHWISKGERRKSWEATWRNWLLRADEWSRPQERSTTKVSAFAPGARGF
jgi:hypothetical protein